MVHRGLKLDEDILGNNLYFHTAEDGNPFYFDPGGVAVADNVPTA